MKKTTTNSQSKKVSQKTLDVLEEQSKLYNGIMPAIRGEYYSYASVFNEEKPLYVFMKCKSSKARSIHEASKLGHEANALFKFEKNTLQVLSSKVAVAAGLINSNTSLDDTWFCATNLTSKQFIDLRTKKDTQELVSTCKNLVINKQTALKLHEGLVVAFITSGGKYGMFLIEEIVNSSVRIEACHVLT